jgi:hypothetical protein
VAGERHGWPLHAAGSARVESGNPHLQTLDRRVDVAHRAAGRTFLAHHVPRFERLAQLQLDPGVLDRAEARKAELEMRREPVGSNA